MGLSHIRYGSSLLAQVHGDFYIVLCVVVPWSAVLLMFGCSVCGREVSFCHTVSVSGNKKCKMVLKHKFLHGVTPRKLYTMKAEVSNAISFVVNCHHLIFLGFWVYPGRFE